MYEIRNPTLKEMKPVYIYGLREPDTQLIRYIGKTNNPRRRWLNHLCEKSRTRRSCWIRSLQKRGLEPEMVIIEEISGAWPWQESERYWIQFAKENDWPLVNMTSGGDGVPDSAATPRKYSGDDHWTHKKPERLARGDNNGSRKHPDAIWRGSRCKSSKLTEDQVTTIKRLRESGETLVALAKKFNVSHENIAAIVNGKTWRHVK